MQGCALHPALDTCRKSPLIPPFDLAQGMLFQRGGFFSPARSNSTTLRVIVAALSFLCPLLFAGLCAAHPLGNFSISQYSALRVGQDSITLRYIVDMAEIPTFQEIQETGIIPNGDDPNTQAYLAKKILALRDGLSLEIGGRRLPLHADSKEIIFPAGAGGMPTLKIGVSYTARLPASANGLKFSFNYRDGNFVGRAGWKEITVAPAAGVQIENSSVPASDRSAGLSNYPTDLLNTPPQDLEARVVFSVPVITATLVGEEKSSSLADEVITPVSSVPSRARRTTSDQPLDQRVYVKNVGEGRDRPLPKEATSPERSPALNLESSIDNKVVQLQVNKQSTPRDSFTELIARKQLGWSVVLIALAVAVGLGAFHALGARSRQDSGRRVSRWLAGHHEACAAARTDRHRGAYIRGVSFGGDHALRIAVHRTGAALSLAGRSVRRHDYDSRNGSSFSALPKQRRRPLTPPPRSRATRPSS